MTRGTPPLLGAVCVALALSGCTPGGSSPADAGGAGGRNDRGGPDTALVATADVVRTPSATGEPLELRLSVRNDTGRPLALLSWNTPFEETLSADLFAVTRDGETVPYRGRLIKRAVPPAAADHVNLVPGETFERVVDLARDYDVGRAGTYRIRFTPAAAAADGGPVRLVGDGRELVVERL